MKGGDDDAKKAELGTEVLTSVLRCMLRVLRGSESFYVLVSLLRRIYLVQDDSNQHFSVICWHSYQQLSCRHNTLVSWLGSAINISRLCKLVLKIISAVEPLGKRSNSYACRRALTHRAQAN